MLLEQLSTNNNWLGKQNNRNLRYCDSEGLEDACETDVVPKIVISRS